MNGVAGDGLSDLQLIVSIVPAEATIPNAVGPRNEQLATSSGWLFGCAEPVDDSPAVEAIGAQSGTKPHHHRKMVPVSQYVLRPSRSWVLGCHFFTLLVGAESPSRTLTEREPVPLRDHLTLTAEPGAKRVRGYRRGRKIVDSIEPVLVFEIPNYPAYYFRRDDVDMDTLLMSDHVRTGLPIAGEADVFSLVVDDFTAADVAWSYKQSSLPAIDGLLRFTWDSMDSWFEEDEEVFVHPRSPYVRIDALPSSRHVQIKLDGVLVADTHRPTLLFETDLPARYYVPKVDVRMELLRTTDASSQCPYKGTARYWSVDTGTRVHKDVVWSYPTPHAESGKIAGMLAFYDDRVDIFVDGMPLHRSRFQVS